MSDYSVYGAVAGGLFRLSDVYAQASGHGVTKEQVDAAIQSDERIKIEKKGRGFSLSIRQSQGDLPSAETDGDQAPATVATEKPARKSREPRPPAYTPEEKDAELDGLTVQAPGAWSVLASKMQELNKVQGSFDSDVRALQDQIQALQDANRHANKARLIWRDFGRELASF